MKYHFLRTTILLSFSLMLPFATLAEEQVLSFKSQIEIKANKSITVTESLVVRVEGDRFKLGLIRALRRKMSKDSESFFPLKYKVHTVKRNGKKANYKTRETDDLLILQIFDPGTFLDHADHRYIISYTVSGYDFHDSETDSFMWHVTGFGWPIPLQLAEAQLTLPGLIDPTTVVASGHTGTPEEPDYGNVVNRVRSGGIHYTTLAPIVDEGGLTIHARWARGFFKSTRLLSVPSDKQHSHESGPLLSVPDAALPQREHTPATLNPALFTPAAIDRLFAEIRIERSGDILVTETITVQSGSTDLQGLRRAVPGLLPVAAEYALIGEQELQIESAPGKNAHYLIAPEQLSPGIHTFLFQYRIRGAVQKKKEFDVVRYFLGDTAVKEAIAEVSASVIPPDPMLPESAIVTATVSGAKAYSPGVDTGSDSIRISSNKAIPAGGTLTIEARLPKGFIE